MEREENNTGAVVLHSLLSLERILVLKGRLSKKDVLLAMIETIAGEYCDRDDLEWGIFHRESLMSTGIGSGIAIPHVSLPNVEETRVAMALCPDGISDYQSQDAQPVRLVFMIVAGKNNQKPPLLKVLAKIGTLFYDGRLKAAFLAAHDPKTCMEILIRAES